MSPKSQPFFYEGSEVNQEFLYEGPEITKALAEFVVNFDLNAVDPSVVDAAKILILDGLGVLVAGAHHPVADILLEYANGMGGRESCTLLRQGKSNAPLVAFVHGSMLHVNDYEPHGVVPMHGTSNILPPALALAEQYGREGGDVLSSIIVGWEVQSRLRGAGPEDIGGFHPPGIFGPLGAAATSGRLLSLSQVQMVMAFGIAASRAGGLFANNGTMVKSTHPGNAGRMGVEAAMLAKRGFMSNPDIVGAPRGFAYTIYRGMFRGDEVLDHLGDASNLVDPGFLIKNFPAQVYMQRVLESCAALKKKTNVQVADIERIEVELSHVRPDLSRPNPLSGLDGKFSYEYCAAVAIAEDRVGVRSFTDEVRFSSTVSELLKRVTVVSNDQIPNGLYNTWVVARAFLRDGRIVEEKCKDFKGSPSNPMTRGERVAKFANCVSDLWSSQQQEMAIDAVENLEVPGRLGVILSLMGLVQ